MAANVRPFFEKEKEFFKKLITNCKLLCGRKGKKFSSEKKICWRPMKKKIKINILLLFNHFIQMSANPCSFLFSQAIYRKVTFWTH